MAEHTRKRDLGGQLWRRAWFASALVLVVAVVVHVHAGRLLPAPSDDLLALGFEQRVCTQRLAREGLELDSAVRRGEYERIEPLMRGLVASAEAWEQRDTQIRAADDHEIADAIARLGISRHKIQGGLEELLLVGRSAVRRAPYLDSETESRIARGAAVVGEGEGEYEAALASITAQRQRVIGERITRFRKASRVGLGVLVAVTLLGTPIVVVPALGVLRAGRRESALDAGSMRIDDRLEPDTQTARRAA